LRSAFGNDTVTLNDYEYENGVPISKPGSPDIDGAVCFAVDRY